MEERIHRYWVVSHEDVAVHRYPRVLDSADRAKEDPLVRHGPLALLPGRMHASGSTGSVVNTSARSGPLRLSENTHQDLLKSKRTAMKESCERMQDW